MIPLLLLLTVADWRRADVNVRRLPPSAFRELPAPVRAELEARRCRIPQEHFDRRPHNVIRGHFLSATSDDWAVLCSRRRMSTILVFVNHSASDVREIDRTADMSYLQTIDTQRIGYSHRLRVAGPEVMRGYFRYVGRKPPLLSHDGIEDCFEEKGSVVRYFARGGWLELPGAD